LGVGFKEAVYKDALELEFLHNSIPFSKETKFLIEYKGVNLKHNYRADFIVFDCIILEVKSSAFIIDWHIAQAINYLKSSRLQLAIVANFGERSFTFRRLIF